MQQLLNLGVFRTLPYTSLDQINQEKMRTSIFISLILGLLAIVAAYVHVSWRNFDAPQPVEMGETEVQRIRDSEGTLQTWTYTKAQLPEDAQGNESSGAPPASGAASLLNEKALNAWNIGDIRTAIALFESAIAADPNDPTPHSNYGRRLTVMVAYDKALSMLLHASELTPDDPQVWLDLLTLYEKTLQFQKAHATRQRARELAGDRAFVRNQQGAWALDGMTLP